MQGVLRPECSPAATDCQPAAERQPYPKITLDIACRTNRKESLAVQGFSLVSRHHARRNHRCTMPRHPRPPAGAKRHRAHWNYRCIFPHRITAHLGPPLLRACAGPEPGSNLPHGTRRVCCARRMRDANGNAAQTGGLARQVRQRMNRLGKPEHRARFCFFFKKKSRAGMRRFPIPSKSRFRWALTAAPQASQPQKPFFNRRPSPARSANHTRWNHRRITPAILARRMALAPPRPPKPPHLPPASHHRAPWSCPLRACAGPEPGSSMPHGARRACRARRIGDANGNAAQTGGLARQVRQRMNRLGKPEHRARFCFFF